MADVQYYRNILKDQTKILDLNIEKYNKILDEDLDTLPESVIGQIRLVIGQSRLFINERFKQFSGLIDDCEFKRGEKEIKIEDLAGFWDMINYQIDDLKTKYDELEQLSLNNWMPTVTVDVDDKPQAQKSSTNGGFNGLRKPLQATNGRSKKVTTTTNGNIKSNQNDKVDGDTTSSKNKKPIKSNFREFLKNKAKEKRNSTNDGDNTDNSDDANIDGSKFIEIKTNTTHNESTSNGQSNVDDNSSVLIMFNNENDSTKLKNGHAVELNNNKNNNSAKDLLNDCVQPEDINNGDGGGGDDDIKTTTKLLLNKMR